MCVWVCVCVCVYLCVCSVCSVMSNSLQPHGLEPLIGARQAFLYIEFSRQAYCSGLPFPTAKNLPDPGIEPGSLVSPALACEIFTTVPPGKPKTFYKEIQTHNFKKRCK